MDMGDLITAIEFIGIPMTIAISIIVLVFVLQVIGEIMELCGKIVPEFMKIRKYFKRRKDERIYTDSLLESVKTTLGEINAHYSADNIAKRNEWMAWVNERAKVYDESLTDLRDLKDALKSNNELTLDLYINTNRHRIIDFASKVISEDTPVSREEFNRIFKVHDEYEEILKQHGKTNGEVDVAFRIIKESYESHMKHHTFLEDVRGY